MVSNQDRMRTDGLKQEMEYRHNKEIGKMVYSMVVNDWNYLTNQVISTG